MVFLLGCASGFAGTPRPAQEQTAPPPAAATAPIDAGEDHGGDADFHSAARRAFTGDPAAAQTALAAFLAHHPSHRQRAAAVALLARVLFGQGDVTGAKALLDQNVPPAPLADHDFLTGLCESRLGKPERALALLRAFVAAGPPSIGGMPDPQAKALLSLALAEALAENHDPAGAIDHLDSYRQLDGVRDYERIFAQQRAEEIAGKVSDGDALKALSDRHGSLARALLGPKAVVALRNRGDQANAVRVEQDITAARRQLGLETVLPWAGPGDPMRFGLVLPFSGPQVRLGEVVLRGAMLVITAAAHSLQPVPYTLVLRDAASTPDRSAQGGGPSAGLLSLVRDESVIGAVSTPDPKSVELATRDGVPLLLLDEHAPGAATTAFQLIHSVEARAVALARKALTLGARRFAILGPDSAGGRRLGAAFRSAVEGGGGVVTGSLTYPSGATSFSTQVANLRKIEFDALFVPDDASRLELVAPALAVADIWPRAPGAYSASAHSAGGHGRRDILLLSTALSVSPKLLHNAERYVQGALLCPGFYPSDDNRSGSFVARFKETYGTSPSAADAYGYDATFLLRGAVERGARTRADVLRILAKETFEGITGDIRFGADHGRLDAPLVYVVDGDTIRPLK
jgi:ABC-type branched-subunit amino acid transport system substrate-binding protein